MTASNDPFASVVGQPLAKRALLLLAVEPRLGGVLMALPSGMGKRRLVKAFAWLLEELKAPGWEAGLVRVPLGVTDDRLLGGLSPEPAAAGARWRYRKGLLAQADGGVLQVDHLNLLPESSLRAIASALDCGRVSVEREGVSASHRARFVMVGTYHPAEGDPAAILQARVGLLVDGSATPDLDERRRVLEQLPAFERAGRDSLPAGAGPSRAAAGSIRQARGRLGRVRFPDAELRRLIAAAAQLGLEGHRTDLFALLAARAHAALAGRSQVCEEDLEMAARLVLLPRALPVDREPAAGPSPEQAQSEEGRAGADPGPEPGAPAEDRTTPGEAPPKPVDPLPGAFPEEMTGQAPAARAGGRRPGPRTQASPGSRGRAFRTGLQPDRRRSIAVAATDREPAAGPSPEQAQSEEGRSGADPGPEPGAPAEDRTTPGEAPPKPVDPLPGAFPDEMTGQAPAARAGGRRPGPRTQASPGSRGRAFRTGLQPDRRRSIAVAATLRAAAPWQSWRRRQAAAAPGGGREGPSAPGSEMAARAGKAGAGMVIRASDLRFQRLRGKAGLLFIFVVDASGSMAVNRMAQAKGAMARLLQQAYVFRDQVALVRFGGEGAETLLPPTRSVQRAKRLVEALPAGGATPLAAGLVQALGVARSAKLRGAPQPVLLILTDGRANRPARPGPVGAVPPAVLQRELRLLGAEIQRESLTAVVVDTRPSFLGGGEGETLAGWIRARYLRLPRADQGVLFQAVKSVAQEVRGKAG